MEVKIERVKPVKRPRNDSSGKPAKKQKKVQSQKNQPTQRIPTIFQNLNLPIIKYGESFAGSLNPLPKNQVNEQEKSVVEPKKINRKGNRIFQDCYIKDLIKYIRPYTFAPIKATKDNPIMEWVIVGRVNVVWDWRGEVRFFIVDQLGYEAKCVLEKQAYKKYYRDFIKKNEYYKMSKGNICYTKDDGVRMINFTSKSQIQHIPSQDFKLQPQHVWRIHQIAQKYEKNNGLATVIGIVKDGIDKSEFMKKGKTNMYAIVLCDPIFKYQIKVNEFYVSSQFIVGGQICVLHSFQVTDTIDGVFALKSTRCSYYTIEEDVSDQLVKFYKDGLDNSPNWKEEEYVKLKKCKFIIRSIDQILKLIEQAEEKQQILSVVNCFISDIKVYEEFSKPEKQDQKSVRYFSLMITCDDQTNKIQANLGWEHVGKLTDLTMEEYYDICQKQSRQEVQANLQMFIKTKATINIKSTKKLGGAVDNQVDYLEVWKQDESSKL